MKLLLTTMVLLSALPLRAQDNPTTEIQETVLDTKAPIPVAVGPVTATTLMFPEAVDTIIGYGLTDGESPGTYHYTHPDKSRLVALRNVVPGKEAFMTVVMGEELYVFHLLSSDDPVIALKLMKATPKAAKVARVMVRAWPHPTGPSIPEFARLDTHMRTALLDTATPYCPKIRIVVVSSGVTVVIA